MNVFSNCVQDDYFYLMSEAREKRILEVQSNRQRDLTVVLENVWDPHNISAVLRSCDAVGIQEVFILSTLSQKVSKLGKKSSAGAAKWLTIHHYFDLHECFEVLRNKYSRIYSTRLAEKVYSVYDIDLTQSVALVFGNEKDGVSPEAANLSDGNFSIPQIGMISSLNISVACAVTLYECYRQRSAKGLYAKNVESNL